MSAPNNYAAYNDDGSSASVHKKLFLQTSLFLVQRILMLFIFFVNTYF